MKLYDQRLRSRHSVDSSADPAANCEQALAADRCRWDYDATAATTAATSAPDSARSPSGCRPSASKARAVFREPVRSVVPW